VDTLHAFGKIDFSQYNGNVPAGEPKADHRSISAANTDKPQHPLDQIELQHLDVESKKLFGKTLVEYKDTFSANERDIGRTSLVKHRIILTTETPIHKYPYRTPHRLRPVMEDILDRMKETGAIRESISPYASPAFLVNKDQGRDKRLVADYRELNAKTVPDRTPMPHPEDVFMLLTGMKKFVKLDITSMFNQIEIDERDVAKTAMTTPLGLFECPLMPFGLMNAPATAVRLMREVLRGLDNEICYVYFDDVIVCAKDNEELVQRCTQVFERLRTHNLKLKPSKCALGQDSVKFLGHVISARGIDVDPARIECIAKLRPPRNPTEVRSFHGLCSYNRKFIKNFADLAKLLTPLMGKDSEFSWSDDAQRAFETLKNTLLKAPTLVHYNPDAKHELRTDASAYSIGAILYQKHDDKDQTGVVTYYSKTLNHTQRRYSATERELLAAFKAVLALKHYLLGKKFTLVTDHAALSSLRNDRDPHHRLARWSAQLFGFEFDVEYKKGRSHLDADCMSRLVEGTQIVDEATDTDKDAADAGEREEFLTRAVSNITRQEDDPDRNAENGTA